MINELKKTTKPFLIQALNSANSEIEGRNELIKSYKEEVSDLKNERLLGEESIKHLNGEIDTANFVMNKLQSVIEARLAMIEPSHNEIMQRHEATNTACNCKIPEPDFYETGEVKLLNHMLEITRTPSHHDIREEVNGYLDSRSYGSRLRR
jgi:chromosome segregation ATPase